MSALAHVDQKRLHGIEFGTLSADLVQSVLDHPERPWFFAMQDLTDLGQAQSNRPAGLHNPQTSKRLLGVNPVPGGCSSRDNDRLILPMTQYVSRHAWHTVVGGGMAACGATDVREAPGPPAGHARLRCVDL